MKKTGKSFIFPLLNLKLKINGWLNIYFIDARLSIITSIKKMKYKMQFSVENEKNITKSLAYYTKLYIFSHLVKLH